MLQILLISYIIQLFPQELMAPNIKVAEASKAIENAQRDINISFVNELA